MSDPVCIPFSIPNLYQGLATLTGLVKGTKAGLLLEFETRDTVVGLLKSGLKEVRIPVEELSRVDLKAGWFKTALVIRTRSMAVLKDVPTRLPGEIELRLARKDRQTAQGLVSELKLSLAERELRRLGERA